MCENMVIATCLTIWKSRMTTKEIAAACKMTRLWNMTIDKRNNCPAGSRERLDWNKALGEMFNYALDRGWRMRIEGHWDDLGMYEYGRLAYCVKWR